MNEKEALPASIAINQIFTMIELYNPDFWIETVKQMVDKHGKENIFENMYATGADFDNFTLKRLEEAREIIWSSELNNRPSGQRLAIYLSGRIDQLEDIQSRIK